MTLDPESCWRACSASDARFDGRFFVGVVTTGIYCRPICPAPKPKKRNARFFATASAAAAAGFRPCLRCRPESAPGTPGWRGTSATVSRALRLIDDGALLRDGVDTLADELGMGARQLRRLFVEHVGAPPLVVAHTQRLHFAKKLVDETRLPMGEIAAAAGYASVRRFNDSFLKVYGRAPRELRRDGAEDERPIATGGLELKLAFRGSYDWDGMLAFRAPRATPGVERVEGRGYARTIRVGDGRGTLVATSSRARRHVVLALRLPTTDGLFDVVRRARRMFDLDADPSQIGEHLEGDPTIGPLLLARPGLRVPGAWDPFELAVRAVLGQQVSVKGATTLAGRLVARWGEDYPGAADLGLTHVFPRPETLAGADLRAIGLPGKRAETLRLLAVAFRDGVFDDLAGAGLEDRVARLRELPGIGDWTAHYVAMRAWGEPDAFPAGDLGLRKAVGKDGPVAAADLEKLAEAWRPWRAVAAMHLWASLEPPATGTKEQER